MACNRQDGRITQLTEEVAELRQEIRHLRNLKAEVDRLDQELKQARNTSESTNNSQSNAKEKSEDSNSELAKNSSADSAEARARMGSSGQMELGEAAVFEAHTDASASYLDDPFLGSKQATTIVMAFIDFQSRASALFYKTIFSELSKEFADKSLIRFVIRDYPLESNENALMAAQIANCAGEQGKYWEVFRSFFENPKIVENANWPQTTAHIEGLDRSKIRKCIKANRYQKEILSDQKDGVELGVKGTPSFFIANLRQDKQLSGTVIRGSQPYPLVRKYIKESLKLKANQ